MRSLLLLALLAAAHGARSKARVEEEDSAEVEEADGEWERIACDVYDYCLQHYDERFGECGHGVQRESEEEDACHEPIRIFVAQLNEKKEKRNQMLRRCYSTGSVDDAEKRRRSKAEEATVGKRHRSSCRQKFGELEQFLTAKKKKLVGKHPAANPIGAESCVASAKRVKERCQKIESCCPRVKSCRAKIASHALNEEMRQLEAKIRDERRVCREREYLH